MCKIFKGHKGPYLDEADMSKIRDELLEELDQSRTRIRPVQPGIRIGQIVNDNAAAVLIIRDNYKLTDPYRTAALVEPEQQAVQGWTVEQEHNYFVKEVDRELDRVIRSLFPVSWFKQKIALLLKW